MKKKLFLMLPLLVAIILGESSCKKDNVGDSPESNIGKLEAWYKTYTRNESQDFSIFNDKTNPIVKSGNFASRPFDGDWSKAMARRTSDSVITEVPIKSKGKFGFKYKDQKIDMIEGEGNARLLFIETKGAISAYFMVLIPDKPNKNIEKSTSFLKKHPQFTGNILYLTLSGELVIGERLDKGKVITYSYPNSKAKAQTGKRVKQEALYNCEFTVVEYWYQDCFYSSTTGALLWCNDPVVYDVVVTSNCTLIPQQPEGGESSPPNDDCPPSGPITVSQVPPGGCGTSPNTPPTLCEVSDADINSIEGSPDSELISEEYEAGATAQLRKIIYKWRFHSGGNYAFYSLDKATQVNSSQGWVWQSIQHLGELSHANIIGIDVSCKVVAAESSISDPKYGKMKLYYELKYSAICEGISLGKTRSHWALKTFPIGN